MHKLGDWEKAVKNREKAVKTGRKQSRPGESSQDREKAAKTGRVDRSVFLIPSQDKPYQSIFRINLFQRTFRFIFLRPTIQLNYQYCHVPCTVISLGYKNSQEKQKIPDFVRKT